MSRLQVTIPENYSVGVMRSVRNQYNLTVDYGFTEDGGMIGGWTMESLYWIYRGLDDWTEVQTYLATLSLTSTVID